MIPLLLMLADVPPMTAVDAERAFAGDAKVDGQWSAFRKWSTDDAVMFAPQPVNAHDFLKDRKDPPVAIDWWPTASYVSCDGNLAVNTGGWKRPDGTVGYFSTVWQRQPDGGWKWIVDGGDGLKAERPRPEKVKVRKGTCGPKMGPMPAFANNASSRNGAASDGSLMWFWGVKPDGSRQFTVSIQVGNRTELVIDDKISAPPQ